MSEITNDNYPYQSLGELAVSTSATTPLINVAIPPQATSDEMLIDLWVHGRSIHTQRAYQTDINRFRCFTSKPLIETRLIDLQAFSDSLEAAGLAPASRNRIIAAVKSLFSFGHRLGYLPFDVAKPLRIGAVRDTLAERILDEADVQKILALEQHPRNSVLLLLAYASGARVSELSGLRWIDCLRHTNGSGQITVFGKRGKTRSIYLPSSVIGRVMALRPEAAKDNDPVFLSRRRRFLSPPQILKIVKQAAKRAGINRNVVVHSLRHCFASHSLNRGAPISLVQFNLGHSSVATTGKYLHSRAQDGAANYLPL